MELRDLRYFVVVAEHRNLAHAAEALDLSATALGKSLRRLEKSVGGKLVQRAAKGVALTAVGTSLLNRIAPLQGMLNDVRHEAASLVQGRAGHINVGSSAGTQEHRLANAYVSLQKESPAITLTVTVSDNIVLSKALHKGELDFCLAGPRSLPPTEFVREHLYDDPFVVYASARHRLAKRRQVSIEELAGERWATSNSTSLPQWQALFRVFENNGLPAPCIALKTNSAAFSTFAIAHSNLVGLSSIAHLRREALKLPLFELTVKELFPVRRIFIIYRKGAYLSPAAQRLIEILKAQAREGSDGTRGRRDAEHARAHGH